jgi:hypothetical protein
MPLTTLPPRFRAAAGLSFVLGAALLAFLPALRGGFVWDDTEFIVGNPVVHDLKNIPLFLTKGDAYGTGGVNPYYRPLTTMTFALDYRLWGDRPSGYHATNLLFHLAACALVFLLLRRLTTHPGASTLAAALFAAHPAHVEPVAYISARADILCGLFLAGSFLFYLERLRSDSHRFGVLSWAAFLLALLSKVVAVILPVMIALHLILVVKRPRRALLLVPYAAITASFLLVRSLVVGMSTWGNEPLSVRVSTAATILVTYVRDALLPSDPPVFHDVALRTSPADPAVILSWVALLGIAGLAAFAARRLPVTTLGAAWFFAGLLPVSGVITILHPAPMASRYLYVPLIGAAIVVGCLADRAFSTTRGPAFSAAVGAGLTVMAALFVFASRAGLPAWGSSLALWSEAQRDAPDNPLVLSALGWAHKRAGYLDEAERLLHRAASLADEDPATHINLAGIAFLKEDLASAEYHTQRTLGLNPDHAVAHRYRGVLLEKKGRLGPALAAARESVRLSPSDSYSRDLVAHLIRRFDAEGDVPEGPRP